MQCGNFLGEISKANSMSEEKKYVNGETVTDVSGHGVIWNNDNGVIMQYMKILITISQYISAPAYVLIFIRR
jgi:hypothetical protein